MVQGSYVCYDVIFVSSFFYVCCKNCFGKLWSVVVDICDIYNNVFFGKLDFFGDGFVISFDDEIVDCSCFLIKFFSIGDKIGCFINSKVVFGIVFV